MRTRDIYLKNFKFDLRRGRVCKHIRLSHGGKNEEKKERDENSTE